MKKTTLFLSIALGFLLILTLVCVTVYGQTFPDVISMLFPSGLQKQCGLHKLNSAEKASLNRVMSRILAGSSGNLGDSAVAYLKNEGWERDTAVTEPTES